MIQNISFKSPVITKSFPTQNRQKEAVSMPKRDFGKYPVSSFGLSFGTSAKTIIPPAVLETCKKENLTPFATAKVFDKNKCQVGNVYLVNVNSYNEFEQEERFDALDKNGKRLGCVSLFIHNGIREYGSAEQKSNGYIEVLTMYSDGRKQNNEFRGIGAHLHQVALERSFQSGMEGRLKTSPISLEAYEFHESCGFVYPDDDVDADADADMYLPEENIEMLKNKYGGIQLLN